jgi:hypothetical protein
MVISSEVNSVDGQSSKTSSHQDNMEVLASRVQTLTKTLKQRDRLIETIQMKWNTVIEMSIQFETAEEKVQELQAKNSQLSKMAKTFSALLEDKDADLLSKTNEIKRVKQEWDTDVLLRAGEMAVKLASSRAEADDLSDELEQCRVLIRQYEANTAAVQKRQQFRRSSLAWLSKTRPIVEVVPVLESKADTDAEPTETTDHSDSCFSIHSVHEYGKVEEEKGDTAEAEELLKEPVDVYLSALLAMEDRPWTPATDKEAIHDSEEWHQCTMRFN